MNIRQGYNAGPMLGQRHRRWTSIGPALDQYLRLLTWHGWRVPKHRLMSKVYIHEQVKKKSIMSEYRRSVKGNSAQ